MFRDIVISLIGHTAVIGSLFIASTFGGKPIVSELSYYRVTTVTPQSIADLLKKNAAVSEPKREIPQIRTDEPKSLPSQQRKKSQAVKRADTSTTVSTQKKGGSDFKGIRTDAEFEYPEYLMELRDRIQQNWKPPAARQSLSTVVYFRIGRNGKVLRVVVEKATKNIKFDLSAQRAVITSDPLPPLPEGFENESLGVHFEFIYEN